MVAAAIGFISGIALIVVRDLVVASRRKRERASELRWLLYLFLKEIVEGTGRLTQFVRQVSISTASRAKLSLFMGPAQMSQAGALGVGGPFLNAVHDVYRLLDLVQNQVTKFSSSKDIREFTAILAFIRDEFDEYCESVQTIIESTEKEHEGPIPLDVWRAVRRLIGKMLPDFEWGSRDPALHRTPTPNLTHLREQFDRYKLECRTWLNAHKKLSSLFKNAVDDETSRNWINEVKQGALRWNILRCILGFIDAAKEQMIVFDLEEKPNVPPLPRWDWARLLEIGYALADKNMPAATNVMEYQVMETAVEYWHDALRENDPQPYD